MERIKLRGDDNLIKKDLKDIEAERKRIKNDTSLTEEQKKAKLKEQDAKVNTLRLEREGNKFVQSLINALPKSEREGIQVSDFTIMTEGKDDLLSWQEFNDYFGESATSEANNAANFNMFVLDGGKFSQQIFINANAPQIQRAQRGDQNALAFTATGIPHERVHRGGNPSEVDAYTKQRDVLNRMPNAFTNTEIWQSYRQELDIIINKEKKREGRP
jgi:major membrane immunogen (membrane-anchored lipoprotein)